MERFEFGQSGCQPPNPLITGSSGRGIVNQIKTSRQTDLRGQVDLRGWEERAENLVAPSCWLRRKYFPSLPPLRPVSLAHQPSQYNVPGAGGGVPCPSRRSPLPMGSHPRSVAGATEEGKPRRNRSASAALAVPPHVHRTVGIPVPGVLGAGAAAVGAPARWPCPGGGAELVEHWEHWEAGAGVCP